MSENRRNSKTGRRIINNVLLVLLMVTMVGMLAAFGVNIVKIIAKENEKEVAETAVVEKPDNEFINDYYTIGHNATEINKEYFREMNAALDAGDKKAVAEAVAKCFVTEYYTWTNKDGNYDVGGMEYIYTDKMKDFETYSRYNFYKDLDLYISQIGTKNLLEVESVTVTGTEPTKWTNDEGETITDYIVNVNWKYAPSGMSTEGVQNSASIYVTDHDGRMEIWYVQ